MIFADAGYFRDNGDLNLAPRKYIGFRNSDKKKKNENSLVTMDSIPKHAIRLIIYQRKSQKELFEFLEFIIISN